MNEEIYSERMLQCLTIQDLVRVFTLVELSDMTRAGLLQPWLAENFYEETAEFLSVDDIIYWNDDELKLTLCELLEIDLAELADYDAQAIERALNKRHLKEIYGGNGTIVTNQRELIDALNNGDLIIYLVGGVFQIPLNKGGITYYGRENALVEIPNRRDVDFDELEDSLNDLQVFVRHNITVKYARSKNLIFLRGDKIALDESVKKVDVYKLLRGRRAFETLESFSQRAENMRGIVVGKVILNEKDYNINLQLFDLKIDWHLDFLSVARNFIGKFFSCIIPAELAEKIYATERAQLVYADFCASGDFPAIKQLYLITADGTRIDILVTDKPASEEFSEELSLQSPYQNPYQSSFHSFQNQSGNSGGRGYGLEIITVDDDGIIWTYDGEDWV